ncbi:MAG: hypothetical protein ACOCP8_09455, partial [archaeon]
MGCPKGINNNLKFVLNKRYDQTFSMLWIGDIPDKLSAIKPNNIIKYCTYELNGISKIEKFTDEIDGENEYQFVKRFFKYKSGDSWSNQKPIEEIEGLEVDYRLPFELELIYYYAYDGNPKNIGLTNLYIKNINISGEYTLSKVDSEALLTPEKSEIILEPKDVYKIFKIDSFEIIKQDTGNVDYKILYRFTQNNGRTFTPFEPLNIDNLTTLRLDEMRFAQVQYLIQYKSDLGALLIYDIILKGDFQNITANYLKTNRYGLKQECLSYLLENGASEDLLGSVGNGNKWTNSNNSSAFPNDPNNTIEYPDGKNNLDNDYKPNFNGLNINNIETASLSCYRSIGDNFPLQDSGIGGLTGVGDNGLSSEGGFWNPYQSDKIVAWQNLLANQMNSIFGWNVNYFITDPNGNGIDRYMNEYQLKDVVKTDKIKIIVPKNNFPDETLQLNFFNLDLFDTFEINILKDEFKRVFGIEKRPSQDDIIHICITNKLYYVKHTRAIRDVMNASIHYKIVLEKYEQRADIDFKDEESKNIIDNLTDNTTIDELLGEEKIQEEDKVANKEQTYSLAYDKIRHKIYDGVKIEKNPIINDTIKIANSYYDLSGRIDKIAINYTKIDNELKKGNNRTFINWFNFKSSYDPNKYLSNNVFKGYNVKEGTYNLLDNYNEESKIGYRIFTENDSIYLQLNDNIYNFPVEFMTDVWYGLMINLDQRQQKLKFQL